MSEVQFEYAEHFEKILTDWEHKIYLMIGSYGSGKSYNAAAKVFFKALQEKRRVLVVREVFDTHLESTYQLLLEIADIIDPDRKYCTFKKSPLQINFSNGSRIIFRGLDKIEKMKSLQGVSVVWMEEASEIKYGGYKELLLRLRTPEDSLHIILTTNPVSTDNWVYTHFFKDEENNRTIMEDETFYRDKVITLGDTLYHHSTVDDNPFVPESYIRELDKMIEYDPDLYRVARKGLFGVLGKTVLNAVEYWPHDEVMSAIDKVKTPIARQGLDFGFVTSYNCFVRVVVDHDEKYLYVYHEHYKRGESDEELAKALEPYGKYLTYADHEPKSIAFLRQKRLKVSNAKKGTKLEQIKKMRRLRKIVVSDECPNVQRELKNLRFKEDRHGKVIEDELSFDAHSFDSLVYSLSGYEISDMKGMSVGR